MGLNVLSSCWMPGRSTFKLVSPIKTNWENATLTDFIDFDIKVWMEGIFHPLRRIPLSVLWPSNQFLWTFTPSGDLSVRSAYHVLRSSSAGLPKAGLLSLIHI